MAIMGYVGVNGVARKIKKIFIGVDNIARRADDLFIGVNGYARSSFKRAKVRSGILQTKTIEAATATNDRYAIIFGGADGCSSASSHYLSGIVSAFDKNLTEIRGTVTEFNGVNYKAGLNIFGGSIGNRCVFLRRTVSLGADSLEAYDSNLTKSIINLQPVGDDRRMEKIGASAVSLSNYLIIAGTSTGGLSDDGAKRVLCVNNNLTVSDANIGLTNRKYLMSSSNINKQIALFAAGLVKADIGEGSPVDDGYSSSDSKSWTIETYNNNLTKSTMSDLTIRTKANENSGIGYTTHIAGASTKIYALFGYSGVLDAYNSYGTKYTENMPLKLAGMGALGLNYKAMFVGGTNYDHETLSSLDHIHYNTYSDIQEVNIHTLTVSVDSGDIKLSESKILPSTVKIEDYAIIAGGGARNTDSSGATPATDTLDVFK